MRREQRLVGEAFEGVVHALRRLMGHGQETHARAIGQFFLGALIGEQRVHAQRLRSVNERAADIAHVDVAGMSARHQRAGAEQHADDHRGLHIRQLLAHLGEMSADDVAALVGEHADELIGRRRLHQRAGIHEDAVRIHDERVEIGIVDDDDLDVLRGESGGLENRRRVVAQQLFDLGVANHRDAGIGPGLRPRRHAAGKLASATAAAVATATAREAGFAGRTLLGDRATIMSG